MGPVLWVLFVVEVGSALRAPPADAGSDICFLLAADALTVVILTLGFDFNGGAGGGFDMLSIVDAAVPVTDPLREETKAVTSVSRVEGS